MECLWLKEKWVASLFGSFYEEIMMQEHPFFYNAQIFYGNPTDDEEEGEIDFDYPWRITLGENQFVPKNPPGLFIFWMDSPPLNDEPSHFS